MEPGTSVTVSLWKPGVHTHYFSLSLSDTPKAKEDLNSDQISHPVETKHCEIASAYVFVYVCVGRRQ